MTENPHRKVLSEIYGPDRNPSEGVPGYQYARISLTPSNPEDARVIIHTTPTSVRATTAQLLDDSLAADLADHVELYTLDPYNNPSATEAAKPIVELIKPLYNKVIPLLGPHHRIGAGVVAAEPVRFDYSEIIHCIRDTYDQLLDRGASGNSNRGNDHRTGKLAGLRSKITSAVSRVSLRGSAYVMAWSPSTKETLTQHTGLCMINPATATKLQSPAGDAMEADLDGHTRAAAIDSAEALREIGRISPHTPTVLYTNQMEAAGYIAAHLRDHDYQIHVDMHEVPGDIVYRDGDMVRPTIRKSHGDNDETHTPSPVDYMSLF